VATVQTALNVGFDTIVFLLTLCYTLSTFKMQRSLSDQTPWKKSIVSFLIYQGVLKKDLGISIIFMLLIDVLRYGYLFPFLKKTFELTLAQDLS
jgi:hypothetical protein